MGLRLQISLKTRGDDVNFEGDVLNARLSGAPIGTKEKNQFLFLDIDEADFGNVKFSGLNLAGLHKELTDQFKAGEPCPVKVFPFAVYKEAEIPNQPPVVVKRSLFRLDVEALPDKGNVRDKTKDVEPKTAKALTFARAEKPVEAKTLTELSERKK